ncbi:MAG TPA: vWA domain-containing protein [Thermotogota bacterium]|nr:vWA domain-containing protein [Thermotogota bacterium]
MSNDFTLQPKERAKVQGKADIVILCDSTGSMEPTKEGLLRNLNTFLESLGKTQTKSQAPLDWRIRFNVFRDIGVDTNAIDFSGGWITNEEEIKQLNLSKFVPEGGGDAEESTLDAILKTVQETDWAESRTHVLIVFTDAPTKPLSTDPSKGVHQIAQEILSKRVYTFLFAPKDPYFEELAKIATRAGKARMDYNDSVSFGTGLADIDWKSVLEKVGKTVSMDSISGPEKS